MMGDACGRVESIVLRKLSLDIIAVIYSINSAQVRCFQWATREAVKCSPCCCLSVMPFPDVWLLSHVSINVNVFGFVKYM